MDSPECQHLLRHALPTPESETVLRKLLLRPLPQLIGKLIILEYRLRVLIPITLWRIKSTILDLALLRSTGPQLRLGTLRDISEKRTKEDSNNPTQHRSSCPESIPDARIDSAGMQGYRCDIRIFLCATLTEEVVC
jgi:hypothetical protein